MNSSVHYENEMKNEIDFLEILIAYNPLIHWPPERDCISGFPIPATARARLLVDGKAVSCLLFLRHLRVIRQVRSTSSREEETIHSAARSDIEGS